MDVLAGQEKRIKQDVAGNDGVKVGFKPQEQAKP